VEVDQVVAEALVGVVEEDHSKAMELQEDDDAGHPWREGEDGGFLLLRVDAPLLVVDAFLLVVEHQPSLVGNVTLACPSLCLSFLSFAQSGEKTFLSFLPSFLHQSELNTYLVFSISFISVDL